MNDEEEVKRLIQVMSSTGLFSVDRKLVQFILNSPALSVKEHIVDVFESSFKENKTIPSWEEFKEDGNFDIKNKEFPLSIKNLTRLAQINKDNADFRYYVNLCFEKKLIKDTTSIRDWVALQEFVPKISNRVKEEFFLDILKKYKQGKISVSELKFLPEVFKDCKIKDGTLKNWVEELSASLQENTIEQCEALFWKFNKKWDMWFYLPTINDTLSFMDEKRCKVFKAFLFKVINEDKDVLAALKIKAVEEKSKGESYFISYGNGFSKDKFQTILDKCISTIQNWCSENMEEDGWFNNNLVEPKIACIWQEIIKSVCLMYQMNEVMSTSCLEVEPDGVKESAVDFKL